MWIRIARGKTAEPAKLKALVETFTTDPEGLPAGSLGVTFGFAKDGTAVVSSRFESKAAGEAWFSSDQFKARLEKITALGTEITDEFRSDDVVVFGKGGSDDAGFVQVMTGNTSDRAKYEQISNTLDEFLTKERPDVIGGITAFGDNGRYFDVVYFTNEADARVGEKKELSAGAQEILGQLESITSDVEFIDLTDVVTASPK